MARDHRRLAAIVSLDVAGYSRLMGVDDSGTLAALKTHRRELIDPKIAEHNGRIVKTTGDGLLLEFSSVVDAIRCAIEVQRGMDERNAGVAPDKRLDFRVGISVGDIIIDGDDIFGDGVNVAARLEALAEPGGICASNAVREQVHGDLEAMFVDIGEQTLKNIAQPIRVYQIAFNGAEARAAFTLTLPDKPSIAVLPFQNLSDDPKQEYFADGIVEDIITAMSRMRWLFVIARNSSFTYKGRAVDVKQVGRDLGVRYVVEGGVRNAGKLVRITAQLINASTGAHLWADRFDGALEDIFDLQDRVTARIVGAIAPKLEHAEIERAKHKPTASLDAYDYYLRGMASFHRLTREAIDEALQLFYKAIELDPDFASAHGMAAICYARRKSNGWVVNRVQEATETARLVRRVAQCGKDDAVGLATGGVALAVVAGDFDDGASMIDRALMLNPNLAHAWRFSGMVRMFLGEHELAIEHYERAMRLNPLDPEIFWTHGLLAAAHFFAGRYDEASSWAEMSLREQSNWPPAARVAAASHALAGRLERAQNAMARLRQLDPALRVSNISDVINLRRPADFARYAEALRKAGLPE